MYLMSKNMLKKATPLVLSVLTACAPAGKDGATGADGAPGAVGVDGADAKVCAITPIVGGAAGATITCDDGTTASVSGGDTGTDGTGCTAVSNGDGTLTVTCGASAPVVITPTDEVAGCDVFLGSVDYANPAARAAVAGCRTIIGDLNINDLEDGVDLSGLAELRVLNGALSITNLIEAAALPRLTRIDRSLSVESLDVALSFPALVRVGGRLSLSSINGAEEAADATLIDLPVLEVVRDTLQLSGVRGQTLVFPALQTILFGELQVSGCSSTISFPVLTAVQGNISISNNSGLSSFSAPALARANGAISTNGNNALTSFDLSGLRSIRFGFPVEFVNNPLLPACFVPLRATDGTQNIFISGMLPADEASCDNCPGVANENQADLDFDNTGDACDVDVDGDTILDGVDPSPRNGLVCGDSDSDTCDDCSRAGLPDVANDGVDTDGNGACDGVLDAAAGDRCEFTNADNSLMVCAREVNQPTAVELCIAHGGRLYEPRSQQAIDDGLTLSSRDPQRNPWVGMTFDAGTASYLTAPTAVTPLVPPVAFFGGGICVFVEFNRYGTSNCAVPRAFACEQN
jgi:hypothetical protein